MIMIPIRSNKSPDVATAISVGAVLDMQKPGEISKDIFWLMHNFNIFIYLLFLLGSGVSWTRSQRGEQGGLFLWEHMQNLKTCKLLSIWWILLKTEENNAG